MLTILLQNAPEERVSLVKEGNTHSIGLLTDSGFQVQVISEELYNLLLIELGGDKKWIIH